MRVSSAERRRQHLERVASAAGCEDERRGAGALTALLCILSSEGEGALAGEATRGLEALVGGVLVWTASVRESLRRE